MKVNIIISWACAEFTRRNDTSNKEERAMGCLREVLAEGEGYAIVGCSCGAYYLQIGEASVRISSERFTRLARDMASVSAGQRPCRVHVLRPTARSEGN